MTIASEKFRLTVLLLAVFFGVFGVHRFHVGKAGTGLLQLLLTLSVIGFWISSVWVMLDCIWIAAGVFTDKRGRPITVWTNSVAYEENN